MWPVRFASLLLFFTACGRGVGPLAADHGGAALASGEASLEVSGSDAQTFLGFGASVPVAGLRMNVGRWPVTVTDATGNLRPLDALLGGTALAGPPVTFANWVLDPAVVGPTEPDPSAFAERCADLVVALRGRGMPLTAILLKGRGLAPRARQLRAALELRGLGEVSLIAQPAPAPDDAAASALVMDAPAWRVLGGLASESFGEGASARYAALSRTAGKAYWIAAAGSGPTSEENPADDRWAATAAGRLLNDLNQGATHWLWSAEYPLEGLRRRDYLQQVRDAIDLGAALFPVTTSSGDTLPWHRQRPALAFAAARNPDGSWAIAVANLTGIAGAEAGDPSYPSPAREMAVTVSFPPANGVPDGWWYEWHSDAVETEAEEVPVEVSGGTLRLLVGPQELVTARSMPASSGR